ncbi:MAG: hypothetical protein ACFWTY_19960 [Shouchella clausii]
MNMILHIMDILIVNVDLGSVYKLSNYIGE